MISPFKFGLKFASFFILSQIVVVIPVTSSSNVLYPNQDGSGLNVTIDAHQVPADNIDPDTDYKRVGLFVGHELFINKLSLVTQFGYYVYYPFDFEGRTYQRIGLKRYFGDRWFGALTLKSHAAKAEALEFGIGVRL